MTPRKTGRKKRFCSTDCWRKSRRKLPDETACWFCGAELEITGKAGFPKRYCNRVCAQSLRTKQEQEARDRSSVCVICNVSFVGSRARMLYCGVECRKVGNARKAAERWREFAESKGPFKEWDCKWCGRKVQVRSSLQGGKKYHDECAVKARRARNRVKSMKRKGFTTDSTITHESIAERDGYRCYLCGDDVDMSLPRTSRFGATLDHVIPISKGGADSMDNLRLTHWICNVKKSDKIVGVEFVASEA